MNSSPGALGNFKHVTHCAEDNEAASDTEGEDDNISEPLWMKDRS